MAAVINRKWDLEFSLYGLYSFVLFPSGLGWVFLCRVTSCFTVVFLFLSFFFFMWPFFISCSARVVFLFHVFLLGWFCVLQDVGYWLCDSVVWTHDQHGATRNFCRNPLLMIDAAYFPKALSGRVCLSQDTCSENAVCWFKFLFFHCLAQTCNTDVF